MEKLQNAIVAVVILILILMVFFISYGKTSILSFFTTKSPTNTNTVTESSIETTLASTTIPVTTTLNNTKVVYYANNGQTIYLTEGSNLIVRLSSTYWMFNNTENSSVLDQVGQVNYTISGGCVPGEGCGNATAVFTGVGIGTTAVKAWRTSCGEAAGCLPGYGNYSINVVVTG